MALGEAGSLSGVENLVELVFLESPGGIRGCDQPEEKNEQRARMSPLYFWKKDAKSTRIDALFQGAQRMRQKQPAQTL